jgi:hypothetical protein
MVEEASHAIGQAGTTDGKTASITMIIGRQKTAKLHHAFAINDDFRPN